MNAPHTVTLDRAAIARAIPHRGAMCLLDAARALGRRRASSAAPRSHRDPATSAAHARAACWRPARSSTRRRRWRCTARCSAQADGAAASPAILASARGVRAAPARRPATTSPGELRIEATRQAGDAQQILYRFGVSARRPRRSPTAAPRSCSNTPRGAADDRDTGHAATRARHRRQRRPRRARSRARLARDGAHVIVHANRRLEAAAGAGRRRSRAPAAAPRPAPST